jgi:hypothetical protein
MFRLILIPVMDQTHLSFSGAKRLSLLNSKSGGGATTKAALVVRPTLRVQSNISKKKKDRQVAACTRAGAVDGRRPITVGANWETKRFVKSQKISETLKYSTMHICSRVHFRFDHVVEHDRF